MDDEVLGCGGVIAKHIKNKDQVVVCIFCNRAYDGVYNQELIDKEKESAKKVKEFYSSKCIKSFKSNKNVLKLPTLIRLF